MSIELSNKNTRDNFKDSVFQYHIEPSDSGTIHTTNLSLWKMVLMLKPVIEKFQYNHKRHPAIKIQVVLSGEFLPPTILNSGHVGRVQKQSNYLIYLQGKLNMYVTLELT